MYKVPVIVIGCARTGTSAVARVLHENMNVSMGIEFKPYDWRTPEGHYEDKYIKLYNAKFLDGRIALPELMDFYREYSTTRITLNNLWGFKDPKVSHPALLGYLIGFYGYFGTPFFIRCNRSKQLVIKSAIRCFGITESNAIESYDVINKSMDTLLEGRKHLAIDMTERLSDKEIEKRIREGGFDDWLSTFQTD
jgi:hypothetical protein